MLLSATVTVLTQAPGRKKSDPVVLSASLLPSQGTIFGWTGTYTEVETFVAQLVHKAQKMGGSEISFYLFCFQAKIR